MGGQTGRRGAGIVRLAMALGAVVAAGVPGVTAVGAATSPSGAPDALTCPGVFPEGQFVRGMAAGSKPGAYWLFDPRGDVAAEGGAPCLGSLAGSTARIYLQASVVGMAARSDGSGYWLAAADGGVFNYGKAQMFGSLGGLRLNQPIVGMAAAPDGNGYWLVASDGGVFSFGSAGFHGSTGNIALNAPIVGIAATPGGGGYWLVASDGGVFAFGDAPFYGSAGSLPLNSQVIGMASKPDGSGYWLAAADGGVFNYGMAEFRGSAVAKSFRGFATGIAAEPDGGGYHVAVSNGVVIDFRTERFSGGVQIVGHCTLGELSVGQPPSGAPQGAAGTTFAAFEVRRTAGPPLCSIDGGPSIAAVAANGQFIANPGTFPAYGLQPVYLTMSDVAHFFIGTRSPGPCSRQAARFGIALPRDPTVAALSTSTPFPVCQPIDTTPVLPGPLG